MSVLATGGAGYIGSHVVRRLVAAGQGAVVADDLSTGVRSRVGGSPFLHVDLTDQREVDRLSRFMSENDVRSVVHMAALKSVEESVRRPALYYRANVGQLANLLEAMELAGVNDIVFSSTAAVYGGAEDRPVREDDTLLPINPYGASKLACEQLLSWASALGVRAIALRYFNVIGAHSPDMFDSRSENLVTAIKRSVKDRRSPIVFGDNYPTRDGSCVRDFVHVEDLAGAHLLALERLGSLPPRGLTEAFNIGTGTGTTVLEVLAGVGRVLGYGLEPVIEGRRAGDPAVVVADPSRFQAATGWRAQRTLDEGLASSLD